MSYLFAIHGCFPKVLDGQVPGVCTLRALACGEQMIDGALQQAIRHIAAVRDCGILLGFFFYSRMQICCSDKVIFFCLGPGVVDVI